MLCRSWLFRGLLSALCLSAASAAASARGLPTAAFAFVFDDTSLEGALHGRRPDEQARLLRLDAQLRDLLASSGCCELLDPGRLTLPGDPRACGGCALDTARKAGARLAVIGWVQKVSDLILNINLEINDVASGRVLGGGSVDIRGNTDESWSRGLAYLVQRRLPASGWNAADPEHSR